MNELINGSLGRVLVLIVMFVSGSSIASAEMFVLKSGVEFEAFVVDDRGDYLRVSFAQNGRPPIHRIYKEDIVGYPAPSQKQHHKKPAMRESTPKTEETSKPIESKHQPAKVKAEATQEAAFVVRSTQEFLYAVDKIDEELNLALNRYLEYFKKAQMQEDVPKAINVLLDIIRQIEEAKVQVNGLLGTPVTQELKKITLEYYESIIAYQSALLQKAVGKNVGLTMDKIDATERKVDRHGQKFERYLSTLKKEYLSSETLQYVQQTAEEERKWEKDRAEIRDEYYFLISQVKELIEVNEALQKEAKRLIERNMILEKELRTSIYRQEPHKQIMRSHQNKYAPLDLSENSKPRQVGTY